MHTAFNSVWDHYCSSNELRGGPRVNYLPTGGVRSEKPKGRSVAEPYPEISRVAGVAAFERVFEVEGQLIRRHGV